MSNPEQHYIWNGSDFEPVESTPQRSHDPSTGKPIVGTGPDPRRAAIEDALKRMNGGDTFETAAGQFVRSLAAAAMAGDKRVLARDHAAEAAARLLADRGFQVTDETGAAINLEAQREQS